MPFSKKQRGGVKYNTRTNKPKLKINLTNLRSKMKTSKPKLKINLTNLKRKLKTHTNKPKLKINLTKLKRKRYIKMYNKYDAIIYVDAHGVMGKYPTTLTKRTTIDNKLINIDLMRSSPLGCYDALTPLSSQAFKPAFNDVPNSNIIEEIRSMLNIHQQPMTKLVKQGYGLNDPYNHYTRGASHHTKSYANEYRWKVNSNITSFVDTLYSFDTTPEYPLEQISLLYTKTGGFNPTPFSHTQPMSLSELIIQATARGYKQVLIIESTCHAFDDNTSVRLQRNASHMTPKYKAHVVNHAHRVHTQQERVNKRENQKQASKEYNYYLSINPNTSNGESSGEEEELNSSYADVPTEMVNDDNGGGGGGGGGGNGSYGFNMDDAFNMGDKFNFDNVDNNFGNLTLNK